MCEVSLWMYTIPCLRVLPSVLFLLLQAPYGPTKKPRTVCGSPRQAQALLRLAFLRTTITVLQPFGKVLQAEGSDGVPRRLRVVLNRITNRSLAPYRAILLPPPPPGAPSAASGIRSASGGLSLVGLQHCS